MPGVRAGFENDESVAGTDPESAGMIEEQSMDRAPDGELDSFEKPPCSGRPTAVETEQAVSGPDPVGRVIRILHDVEDHLAGEPWRRQSDEGHPSNRDSPLAVQNQRKPRESGTMRLT
jgi:hypothetical protein